MIRKHFGLLSVGRLPILTVLLVAMATAPAKAQTIRGWIDPAGGNYNDILNWTSFNVPDTVSESAQFSIAGTYDVTLNSGVTTLVSDLSVFDDVTFNASGLASAIYEMDDDALILSNLTLMQAPGLGDVTLNVGDLMEIVGGSTVSVFQGSDVTVANLNLAIGGSGGTLATMIVDGVGSSLAVSTLTRLGSGGSTGTLTFQNGSTGNSLSGSVDLMSNSSTAGSTGWLNVLSGSTLQTGNLNVGLSPSASAIQEGTLTVDGTGSTLTMTGASTLTIGDDINPNIVSDVIVSNSAAMSTGTGAILIQNSGHLDVQAGTFNANGNLIVDGGTITRGSGSGGFNLASGLTLTAQNDAQINFGGAYSINQGTTFDIQLSADFDTTGSLDIGDAGGDGTLIVDGLGSRVTNGNASSWGSSGNTADVTFRATASGILSGISLANDTTSGTTGILNVESGAVVTANTLTLAASGGATTSGTITVDGVGSSLAQEGAFDLVVGHATSGTATINVQNGGTFSTGTGVLTVNPTGTINVGVVGTGTFNATSDLTVDGGTITRGSGSTGFNLTTNNTLTAKNDGQINFGGGYNLDQGTTFDIQSGADFSTTDFLDIGSSGDGTLLVDGAGSSVTTGAGSYIWGNNGNTADVTFRNAAIGNLGEVLLANSPVSGTTSIFRVESGAVVTTDSLTVNTGGGTLTSGNITVDGVGSSLTQNGFSDLTLGHATAGTATINVLNSGTFTTGANLNRINNSGLINVSTGGTFNANGNLILEGTLTFSNGSTGNLSDTVVTNGGGFSVSQGSEVTTTLLDLGDGVGGNAIMTVGGTGSSVVSSDLSVGLLGQGILVVQGGGHVSSHFTLIGHLPGSIGEATVNGVGSTLTSSSFTIVGSLGNGTLNIMSGGNVSSGPAVIAQNTLANGSTATVDGTGSTWGIRDLTVGLIGQGTLNIDNGGLVTVTDETSINGVSSVVLSNGRFEFGTIKDAASYSRISGTSGEIAGNYPLSGFNALSSIDLSITNLDTSGVRIFNSGVVFGNGVVAQALANTAVGELRTFSGEWARFNGINNTNAGEINNFDGVVEFVQGITNETTGFVGGRGQFIAGGGWNNEGVMAFSAGPADVLGDVVNSATGQIVTTGSAVTTFFDDVVHNGTEIRTADGSSTVIFGAASGAGPYTGTGTVFFEGDLRPGNSPGVVDFGGDVVLGSLLTSEIELFGTDLGLYDQLNVASTISLDGTLDVSLLSGFIPSAGITFEIIQAASIIGTFDSINLPTLPNEMLWFVNQTATTLELVSTYAADFDEEGDVDGSDLSAWEAGFGSSPAAHMDGDANANSIANGLDFLAWQQQFGNGGGAPLAAATATPEPSSLLLAALGVLILSAPRKRA